MVHWGCCLSSASSWNQALPSSSRTLLQAGIDLQKLELSIEVNGAVRQASNTSLMVFKVRVPCSAVFERLGAAFSHAQAHHSCSPCPRFPLCEHMPAQVSEIVAYLQQFFPLRAGDWILTGTPEGVAAIKGGDSVVACVRDETRGVLSEGRWRVEASEQPAGWAMAWKEAR